jgi:hypothetical protein
VPVHETFGKPTYAVASDVEDETVTGVRIAPPSEYGAAPDVADTSFKLEYAVVSAFRLAFAVYKAILITSVVSACIPWYNSALKLVVWVWTMLIAV